MIIYFKNAIPKWSSTTFCIYVTHFSSKQQMTFSMYKHNGLSFYKEVWKSTMYSLRKLLHRNVSKISMKKWNLEKSNYFLKSKNLKIK